MPFIDVRAGRIHYEDTGGDGPVLLFLHGLAVHGALWRHVVAALRDGYRCVVPTLPLGSHRTPMRAGADLSLAGQARIVAEFVERLGVGPVTVVQNDGPVALALAASRPDLVERLVLVSCEAYRGAPRRLLNRAAQAPGGLWLLFQALRVRGLRRMPPFGTWSRRAPASVTDGWFRPLRSSWRNRRDLRSYLLSTTPGAVAEATERLRAFDRPALVVWAFEDRGRPLSHGVRLAALLPQGRLVEIGDSATLIPEDQPRVLSLALRRFLEQTASSPSPEQAAPSFAGHEEAAPEWCSGAASS
ncbi:alpha/beta hydrolase [Nonomuraea sp. NPDC050310]|uniref:alpha/beta fold hydrolase n=1 Tax=Nonomuraea sp. NPDC050310 TaxID=3154935 RepID=UPI0033C1EF7D